jgi:hypothetical protein
MGALAKSMEAHLYGGQEISNATSDLQYNLQIITDVGIAAGSIKVEVLNVTRDYANGFTDEILVSFKMDKTAFYSYIWHYRTNLNVDLTVFDGTTSEQLSTTRYLMFIMSPTDVESNPEFNTKTDKAGLGNDFVDVQAQLVYQFDAIAKSCRVTDNYTTATMSDVILSEFEDAFSNIKLSSGEPAYSINLIPPDNQTLYTNILLSPGKDTKILKLTEFPEYLQNHPAYGVYNSDIGVYIQHNYATKKTGQNDRADLFVYPIYRPNVDPSSGDYPYCIVYSSNTTLPRVGDPSLGYRIDDKHNVYIFPASPVRVNDDGGNSTRDNPSGFLYLDPSILLARTGQIGEDNTKLVVQNGLKSTFNIRESYDDINNEVSVGLCSNQCLLNAKGILPSIAIYEVDVFNVTFEHIYPGMPAIIHYEIGKGEDTRTIYGTVVMTTYTIFAHNHSLTGKILIAGGRLNYYNKTKKEKEAEQSE